MPDDSRDHEFDTEIIRSAYADKVKEAFKVFADNVGMGQNLKNSTERFLRTLELTRRARDLAIESLSASTAPAAPAEEQPNAAREAQNAADGLSAEDQALIEQALAGTTGQKPVLRR